MSRYELTDQDYTLNAQLDVETVLQKMGFTEHSIYQEGDIMRVHCPIHKDLVRKSLIVDTIEKTFKCQYANCDAHEGGLLVELAALYYDIEVSEVSRALFGEEDKSADLLFRGEMFINQGRHQEALPYLEQASDFNPRHEITRCKLAALYLELNRKDDAYREYLNAAESYAVRGELDKTLSIYNILIMLQPGAVKARKELSFLFSRLGRPDAAAEQLKWVVDFYMKYNQHKGAQETCEQILEMDPENGMAHYLLGVLMQTQSKRIQAVQSFEMAARCFLKSEEYSRATDTLNQALELAPTNGRLTELQSELETTIANLPPDQLSVVRRRISSEEEEQFIEWLEGVDDQLLSGEEDVKPRSGLQISSDGIPTISREDVAIGDLRAEESSTEIPKEDARVALCLKDFQDLDSKQIEEMRQQLISMFADVRKSYDEGVIAEWEMRTIKEFYKAFCVAVDVHRKQKK